MVPKKDPWNYIGQILPIVLVAGSIVMAFSVLGEKVQSHEKEIIKLNSTCSQNERYNSEDHKLILQKLGEIQGTLDAIKRLTLDK